MKTSLVCAAASLLSALAVTAAPAAEIRILAGGGVRGPLDVLAPLFEMASGHKVTIWYGATPQLIRESTSGTPFDAAVVPVDVFKDASAKATFVAGPTTDIARAGYSVAVKAGAQKPDIATPEAFKQTLLNAKSITYLPESAAGSYVTSVFNRLGILDAMKAKTKAQTVPPAIPKAVADGDAELGIFLTNVLIAPGVEVVGPFPGDLQNDLVFTSAVSAASKEAAAAKAFLAYLQTPEAVAVIRAKGMQPGARSGT